MVFKFELVQGAILFIRAKNKLEALAKYNLFTKSYTTKSVDEGLIDEY